MQDFLSAAAAAAAAAAAMLLLCLQIGTERSIDSVSFGRPIYRAHVAARSVISTLRLGIKQKMDLHEKHTSVTPKCKSAAFRILASSPLHDSSGFKAEEAEP